jgi:hypothetical protein
MDLLLVMPLTEDLTPHKDLRPSLSKNCEKNKRYLKKWKILLENFIMSSPNGSISLGDKFKHSNHQQQLK